MKPSPYQVVVTPAAEREMDHLPFDIRDRILKPLLALGDTPRPSSCKKLYVFDLYRIRVGDYRILYSVDGARRNVTVVGVRHRSEAYRRR